jgi:hypothetical protein
MKIIFLCHNSTEPAIEFLFQDFNTTAGVTQQSQSRNEDNISGKIQYFTVSTNLFYM